jgi:ubiquinone/menaquinone biosynthesis C-methylase UbiE
MNFLGLKLRTTREQSKYWKERKIDWVKEYLTTWNHPHRTWIMHILASFQWISLMEVGCGPGPNLMKIIKSFEGKQVGGIDVNAEAIKVAEENFINGRFKVGSGDDIMMSDKSTDVVLTDMCLIYVGPRKIDQYISEIKRITRGRIVLCEFHSESFLTRLKVRLTTGYNAYNYKKLLTKHGFYDTQVFKMPPEAYPGARDMTCRYIITAVTPRNN